MSDLRFTNTANVSFTNTANMSFTLPSLPNAVAPTINNEGCYDDNGTKYAYWNVTNNDLLNADIKSEAFNSSPDLYTDNLDYNATGTTHSYSSNLDVTVYAQATNVSGKNNSSIVSIIIDMDICFLM